MNFDPPTGIQRAALEQAAARPLGAPWLGPRSGAERCCELGWLEATHLAAVDPTTIESVVYTLTKSGRAALSASVAVSMP